MQPVLSVRDTLKAKLLSMPVGTRFTAQWIANAIGVKRYTVQGYLQGFVGIFIKNCSLKAGGQAFCYERIP